MARVMAAFTGWLVMVAIGVTSSSDDVISDRQSWDFMDDTPAEVVTPVAPLTVTRPPLSVVPDRFYKAGKDANPHPYHYVINSPHLCQGNQEVFLLVLIRSGIAHAPQRAAIRDTWGSRDLLAPNATTRLIFLLGLDSKTRRTDTPQQDLEEEQIAHRDIAQQDFRDSHANLTLKVTMGFQWARTYCPKARHVMVADDDVVVDMYKMAAYLETQKENADKRFLVCYLYPCCRPALWQGLPHDLGPLATAYGGTAYPPYCAGAAYVTTSAVVDKLYLMSQETPQFAPDDAWVGVLSEKLGLQFTDTFKSFVGLHVAETGLASYFNHSYYLTSPVMVGVIPAPPPSGAITPHKHQARSPKAGQPAAKSTANGAAIARHMRTLWSVIETHHRGRPNLDVRKYMRLHGYSDQSDSHVYVIALAALVLDLLALAVMGYLIFRRKRSKTNGSPK